MKPGRTDWYEISRRLVHIGYVKPWEFERLTETEIAMYMDHDLESHRPPTGGQSLSPGEVSSYQEEWRRQTLQQRLKRFKEG